MARLVVKSDGFNEQVIELRLGLNRLGRSQENDFQIQHDSISAFHCEVFLNADEVSVRDCGSTNGTFVGEDQVEQVERARLHAGQTLQLGEVELFVESTEAKVAIPKIDVPRPSPPVILPDGSLVCPRHPRARVTHQCTYCREVMCDACVHRLRRRGGKLMKLCPLCSHTCKPLTGEEKKKRSLRDFFHNTVKLPFLHAKRGQD